MSSILDAVARLRPDLNRGTKFQRDGEAIEAMTRPAGEAEVPYDMGDELPLPAEPARFSDIFRYGMLSTFRSRALAMVLAALVMGLGIGYFPKLGPVKARPGEAQADLAKVAGGKIGDAVGAELDKVEAKVKDAGTAAAPAIASAPEAEAQPAKLPERVVVLTMKTKDPQAAASESQAALAAGNAAAGPMLKVELQLRRPADAAATTSTLAAPQMAAAVPVGESIALSGSTVASVGISDEPPGRLVATSGAAKSGDEVLYEAMPSPEMTGDEPPAGDKAAGTKRSTGAGGSGGSGAKAAAKEGEIALSGIFWDKENPMAMINDEILEVGQSVGGAKVLEIGPEVVVIEKNGRRLSLTL